MALSIQINNVQGISSDIKIDLNSQEADALQFCYRGSTKCCYPISGGGFNCGEGPWIDCSGIHHIE